MWLTHKDKIFEISFFYIWTYKFIDITRKQLIPSNIYNLVISDKKNKISKMLFTWVFVNILRFCSWYGLSTPNKIWTKCLGCLISAQTIVFYQNFIEITTLISIWLQLRHNGSSRMLKIFIKSILLAILRYHYRVFKKKRKILFLVKFISFYWALWGQKILTAYLKWKMRYWNLKMLLSQFSNPFWKSL